MARFGNVSLSDINEIAENSTPVNTIKSRKSIWQQFQQFCNQKGYSLMEERCTNNVLNDALKDWAFNMKKANGEDYKESVIKVMWNNTAKQLQDIYFSKFGTKIDPFKDIEFASSRKARDSMRRKLKSCYLSKLYIL